MIFEIYGFPVYKGKFSEPEKVLRYIQDCKLEKADKWNANCFTSAECGSNTLSESDNVCINDEIFDEIVRHASQMLSELDIKLSVSPSECGRLECKQCRDVWINKYTEGHNQNMHWHVDRKKGILFSFAYFAKYDPQKDADFVFVNPIPRGICHKEMLKHPSFSIDAKMNVEEGDILIFPCWMLHYVTTQKSKEPRLTMAGNLYEIKYE